MQSERSERWLALDVFRALAVLWMIQGHTFTALLSPETRYAGVWVQLYSLLHGPTAPMFLVAADGGGLMPLLARHSLVAYVVHLLLLYGTPFSKGLARSGASWDPLETCVAFVWVLGVTASCVWAWPRLLRFSASRAVRELWPDVPGTPRS